MPMKLYSADDFRAAAKNGERLDGTLFKFATAEPVTVDGALRTKRFVFSDATIDHSSDSIDPKGWNLEVFNRNPVALFSHMSWDPPIGRAHNVGVENNALVGDIEFASADVYDFADTIYRLVDGGFLNAVWVGFIPDNWTFSSDKDRPYGIDFKKQTLLEISVCPVPCNPNALGEARSLGVDTRPLVEWAERVLDSGDTVFMPRKDLDALRKQAKEPSRGSRQPEPDDADPARSVVEDDEQRAMSDDNTPTGNCGLAKEAECGMKDPQQCATHFTPPTKASKSGRRISAATKAKLEEAISHHAAATKCITDAMMDEGTEPPDLDDDGGTPSPTPAGPDEPYDLSPEERRLKEARALRASLPAED